jgi:hypothetical protein
VVVFISVVGTLISDNLVDNLGVPLATTAAIFTVALALVFLFWYMSEKTLSVHTIFTHRRELFYWAAILFTFSLGNHCACAEKVSSRRGVPCIAVAHLSTRSIFVAEPVDATFVARPALRSESSPEPECFTDWLPCAVSHASADHGPAPTASRNSTPRSIE